MTAQKRPLCAELACRLVDSRRRRPTAGLQGAFGYWLLAIGYWLLAIGYWLLAIGYWLLVSNPMKAGD